MTDHIGDANKLVWTKTPPTVRGWYRTRHIDCGYVVNRCEYFSDDQIENVDFMGIEVAGPIPEPQEPQG